MGCENGDDLLRQAVCHNFQDVKNGTQEQLEAEVERMCNLVRSAFWQLHNETIVMHGAN